MAQEQFTAESLADRLEALPAHAVYEQLTGNDRWAEGMRRHIPSHMREAVVRYVALGSQRAHSGSFLRAVMSNDLMRAFARADSFNLTAMEGWVSFLFNHTPRACWGGAEAFRDWQGMIPVDAE